MQSSIARATFVALWIFAVASAGAKEPEGRALTGEEWTQKYQRIKNKTEFSPELVYEPRYPERECPPEYTESRDVINRFLGGKGHSNFYQKYSIRLPNSRSELKLLTTEEDGDACLYFNGLLEGVINQQWRLCEDGMAWYVYDFSYYKSDDFFFVVRSGGILKAENPDRPDCFPGMNSLSNSPSVGIYLRNGFYPAPIWN